MAANAACEIYECAKYIILKNTANCLTAERRVSESIVVYVTFVDEDTGGKDF